MPIIKKYYILYKKSKTGYNRTAGVFFNNQGKKQLEFVEVGYKSK